MAIGPGQELLHYRIVEKVGEGGMGVVWKALDTSLDRQVAIKILPEAFAQDAERLARFEREAKLLASLQHPNIAVIHGLHAQDGVRFLVMELIEGEDLSLRMGRGPMPQEEALGIGRQIAEALEAAHEQGVIHRDLKPANVQLMPDGQIKVLDFGLAKAFQADGGSGEAAPSMSPTLTSLGTVAGMILGTAAYMAPEQARGQFVDKRADIWALGVVLFEMLGGRTAFAGDTISDTLASVLKLEPDWTALPDETPRPVRQLVRRCLEKDSKRRLRDVGEARILLDGVLRGEIVEEAAPAAAAGSVVAEAPRRSPVPWIAALVLLGLLSAWAGWFFKPSSVAETPFRRFAITAPEMRSGYTRAPVISRDGSKIAYIAENRLWIRHLGELEVREVPESQGARAFFWSWDGEQIGWVAGERLWRAPAAGGQPAAICDAPDTIDGAAWGPDERIVLAPRTGPLFEVSARGGDAKPFLDVVPEQESDFHKPHFLPDGALLYGVHRVGSRVADTFEVLVDGKRKVVLRIEEHRIEHAQYSPTGHIVYFRSAGNDGIWAVPFSLATHEVTGEALLIDPAGAEPSVAMDGSLVYTEGSLDDEAQLVWVDRQGQELGPVGQPQRGLLFPELSPDGSTVAVTANEDDSRDIWLHDVERGTRTRLTFDPAPEWSPFWAPDGSSVFFTRDFALNAQINSKPMDGATEAVRIVQGQLGHLASDGSRLIFMRVTRETDDDVLHIALDGEAGAEAIPLVSTPASEGGARLSPDGRYFAYVSDESGRREVYLKRFPGGEGKWQVSADGGRWVRWSRSGDELFFVEPDARRLMVVEVTTRPTLRLGAPVELFGEQGTGFDLTGQRPYDVAPDGRRLLVVKPLATGQGGHSLTYVENWIAGFESGD